MESPGCDRKMMFVRTDVLGFHLPPDGGGSWDADVGTDVRTCRRLTDLVARLSGGSRVWVGFHRSGLEMMKRSNVVGTDV